MQDEICRKVGGDVDLPIGSCVMFAKEIILPDPTQSLGYVTKLRKDDSLLEIKYKLL
jgi:hypothetical protein